MIHNNQELEATLARVKHFQKQIEKFEKPKSIRRITVSLSAVFSPKRNTTTGYYQSAKLLERLLRSNEGIISMSMDIKLQQCTTPFKDYLLKDLAQPEFAKGYLEAALQDFDKDGNIETLLLSIKDVAEAQGEIERLATWTNISPQTLTYLLNAEFPPQLDKVLDILSKLKDSST